MFRKTWYTWLKRQAKVSGKQPRKRARSKASLAIEMLEQRMAPAVVAVVTNPIDEYDAYAPPPGLPSPFFPPYGPDLSTSLREAIKFLDDNGGGTLTFKVPKVFVAGPLPPITKKVTIDVPLAPDGHSMVQIIGGGLDLKAPGNTVKGLTISGAFGPGLQLDAGGNDIEHNFLGTDPTGHFAKDPTGHFAEGNAVGLLIVGPDNKIIKNNVISGNIGDGIDIFSTGNVVQHNELGTDVAGMKELPNRAGVTLYNGPNTIGGKLYTEGNVISGNTAYGVCIDGVGAKGNLVEGNFIGTTAPVYGMTSDSVRVGPLPNNIGVGIFHGASGNSIGGTTLEVKQNIISGNTTAGVYISGAGTSKDKATSKNVVQGNYIGTTPDGLHALANGLGVEILFGASSNSIGGTTVGARNVISGNLTAGVLISDADTNLNVVHGNYIGIGSDGLGRLGNGGTGVVIRNGAQKNQIGTDDSHSDKLERNIISNNGLSITGTTTVSGSGSMPPYGTDGVAIFDPGTNENVVAANFIGTDKDGFLKEGNKGRGVAIYNGAQKNQIGVGAAAKDPSAEANVVSNNGDDGVAIYGIATDGTVTSANVVAGNAIGTNLAGYLDMGNTGRGVAIYKEAQGNTIGTDVDANGNGDPTKRNVISANKNAGVLIDFGSSKNVVAGNYIGTQGDGKTALGNKYGVFIDGRASDNTIGGIFTDTGNVIAFSDRSGVTIASGINNAIRRNSIFSNSQASSYGLGIDLGNDGVTYNHNGGPVDGRPNLLQNFPVLTAEVTDGSGTTVRGKLNGAPETLYGLEFFSNSTGSASLYGEGEKFQGGLFVATDAFGNATFETTLPGGKLITATATDPAGNTSEFSSYIKGDLAILKTDGTELADDQELTPGGYVPVNNENNDYTFYTADDPSPAKLYKKGDPMPDWAKTDAAGQPVKIVGEHELVPLNLHRALPLDDAAAQGGNYRLIFTSPNIRVWKNPDRTDQVKSDETEFAADQDSTVYVEGISESASRNREIVNLKWISGDKTKVVFADSVGFTVYQVTGPMDVPDYSIHSYKGDIPGGGTGTWTVTNGTDVSGVKSNDAMIHWSGGPAIGKATFSPAKGFSVDYEVNIVQVKIESPSAGTAFTAGTPTFFGLVNGGRTVYVASGTLGLDGLGQLTVVNPGMVWQAKVTLNGPSEYDVDQRGVTRIEVGFVQNVNFTAVSGFYDFNGSLKSLTANIQGNSYLDPEPGKVYYDTVPSALLKGEDARTREIGSNDTPTAGVPLYYLQGAALSPAGDAPLSFMNWIDTFTLWITARTDDASTIYTSRAKANWKFTVENAYPMGNPDDPLPNASVKVPNAWSDVTNGSQPTLLSGTTANQALSGSAFR